jgi:TPR repeat protein
LVKLGDYYYSGYFVDKNYEYAKKLYELAREKGNTQALLNIGLMKDKGLANDDSDMSPEKVFEGAARLGNANGVLYSGIRKGPHEEREALLKAAELGSI